MKNDEINIRLKEISDKLHIIIKILSVRNNENAVPVPWLGLDSQDKSKELREKNSEIYDYVCEMFKLFFC